MFNLEKQISEWRKQMLAGGIKAPVPLDELEAHLREEIDRQMKSGIDAQQAFKAAALGIGQTKELKHEFAKGTRLRSILEFELVPKELDLKWGPVLHAVLFNGILAAIASMVLFKADNSGGPFFERVPILAAIIVSSLLFNSGLLGFRLFPVIHGNYARLAVFVCGLVLVSSWLMAFLARANLDNIHQFATKFSWAFFVPMGALSGLILGLQRAAHKRASMDGASL